MLSEFNLKNRVAIVTGGCRGLGKAMAIGLAKHGCNIIISDIIEKESEKTAKEIQKLGVKAIAVSTDVSSKDSVDNLIKETIKKFKKIDILINNAGIYNPTPLESMKKQDWDKIMNINLNGYLLCAQSVFPYMKKQKKGAIINVASVAGVSAFANSAAYNCSKAAINMLTKTIATDWAKYGIRCNSICPGVIVTPMAEGLLKDKGFQMMIKTGTPLQRPGKAQELAGLAVYLASDASSYVNGAIITIDGGWTAHL